MKYIVRFILKKLAKKLLKKHNPKVVAVTGSVGKTTTKDAIYHVLNSCEDLKIITNAGNYNNEFGIPLTIFQERPARGAFAWIALVLRCVKKVVFLKEYADVLVLEMAADSPGDIVYLARIAQPDIALVTNVERVHLHHYSSIDELAHEKSTLIHMCKKDGIVLVNYDNKHTRKMMQIVGNRTLYTFGLDREAEVKAFDIENTTLGLKFKVSYNDEVTAIKMPHVIGKHNAYTIMPIFPIAKHFGISAKEVSNALKTFKLPRGRMDLVAGTNDSYLIDSTYNAEPASMKAAITTLKDFPEGKRRVAVVGDMLELGPLEEKSHREIGQYLKESRIDLIFFVGPKMKWAVDELESSRRDYARMFFHFKDSFEAAKEIALKIKKDDVVLVKGSRGMMMERVIHRLSK